MTSGQPTLHHKVPRLYLKGFGLPEKTGVNKKSGRETFKYMLVSQDKDMGAMIPATSSAHLAAENKYNLVPGHPSGPYTFETALGSLEGQLAQVTRTLYFGGDDELSPNSRELLCMLAALQWLRADNARDMVKRAAKSAISEQYRRASRTDLGSFDVEIDTMVYAVLIAGWLLRVTSMFASRPLRVYDFSRTPHRLFTSDEPIVHYPLYAGFQTAETVFFPLTRERAVVFTKPDGTEDSRSIESGRHDRLIERPLPGTAGRMNRSTVEHARRWVYAHPFDEAVMKNEVGVWRGRQFAADFAPAGRCLA